MSTAAITPEAEGGQSVQPELTGQDGLFKKDNDLLDRFETLARSQDVQDFLPVAVQVHKLFKDKARGFGIRGCTTFPQYVKKVFNRSPKSVQRLLAKAGATDQRFARKTRQKTTDLGKNSVGISNKSKMAIREALTEKNRALKAELAAKQPEALPPAPEPAADSEAKEQPFVLQPSRYERRKNADGSLIWIWDTQGNEQVGESVHVSNRPSAAEARYVRKLDKNLVSCNRNN